MSTGEPPPDGSADPSHVLPALAAYEQSLNPTESARERMRARLMAQYPEAVGKARRQRPDPGGRRRLPVVAAGLALLTSLSGMSLLLSQDALPGEALYAVKRTAEGARLGLTFDEAPRARLHLEFAGGRVVELTGLLDQPGTAAADFLRALGDFEADAAAGARLLTELGASSDEGAFAALAAWAGQQQARLRASAPALPGAAQDRLQATLTLLARIQTRANELRQRAGCRAITSGGADDIGALPATGPCAPGPASAREKPPQARPDRGPGGGTTGPGREVLPDPDSPEPTPTPVSPMTGSDTSVTTSTPPPPPSPSPSPSTSTPTRPTSSPVVPSSGVLDLLKLPYGPLGPNR
ncbi:hypothetical protein JOF53_004871 [Crossiella equi]|uniref:DUF5667 domain-containing protein n=1 Tax=Crossiella equi TaxID=130796 RepID=A0ABS5AHF3_9PSEU|nr:DUF5667 domain-containing protein [Crossiella equi]MBP2475999.1 hypothetical protein [Crossiella equi]